ARGHAPPLPRRHELQRDRDGGRVSDRDGQNTVAPRKTTTAGIAHARRIMTKQTVSASGKVWEAIENERRRDRLIRRVSITAWSITFFFVAILAVLVCMQVVQLAKGAAAGALPWISVFGAAMPLVIVLG